MFWEKVQVTGVNSEMIKNKGVCTVQWTVIATLCCVVVSSPALWPQTRSLTSPWCWPRCTRPKWYESHYLCPPCVMFIIRGHAGVMSGAKISARPSNPGINVNTVLRVNRHCGTITGHRYSGDIIKREATNGPPFENRGKAATLYSITLDLFFFFLPPPPPISSPPNQFQLLATDWWYKHNLYYATQSEPSE